MPGFRLDDQLAAVTGAGSGIGRAIATRFAASGARVAVLDRDARTGAETAATIRAAGGEAASYQADVADAVSVQAAFSALRAQLGHPTILVNNAGIAHIGTVETTTETDLDRLYAVNVKSILLCTRAVIGAMKQTHRGVVLNLASIAALIGLVDRFAYMMSKGAVLAMTRSIAIDYLTHGIRCNCICPARVHTPFVDGYLREHYPGREQEMFASLSAYQPIGRMASPDEVADLALYLCSDAAAFVTGQAFPLDGGVLLR